MDTSVSSKLSANVGPDPWCYDQYNENPYDCYAPLFGKSDPSNPVYSTWDPVYVRLARGEEYLRANVQRGAEALEGVHNPTQRLQILSVMRDDLIALNALLKVTPEALERYDQLQMDLKALIIGWVGEPGSQVVARERQIEACRRLGETSEAAALAGLADALLKNEDYAVKGAAAGALNGICDDQTKGYLKTNWPMISNPVLGRLFSIATENGALTDHLGAICDLTIHHEYRHLACAVLSTRTDGFIVEKLKELATRLNLTVVGQFAASALSGIKSAEAEAALISAALTQAKIIGRKQEIRCGFLEPLLRSRTELYPENAKIVQDAIRSADYSVAKAALQIAILSQDPNVHAAAIDVLFEAPSPRLRKVAAESLHQMSISLTEKQRSHLIDEGLHTANIHTHTGTLSLLVADGSLASVKALLEATFPAPRSKRSYTLGAFPALERLRETEHGFETLVSLAGSKFTRLYSRIARGAAKILGQVEGEALRKRAIELGFAKAKRAIELGFTESSKNGAS